MNIPSSKCVTENDLTEYSQFINYTLITKKIMEFFCFAMDYGSVLRVIFDSLINDLKKNSNSAI